MNILFVCNANSCRSPMAAAFFNHLCTQNKITGVAAISAGTQAEEGAPASELAVALMANLGVVIENHISRRVTAEMVSDCEGQYGMVRNGEGWRGMERGDEGMVRGWCEESLGGGGDEIGEGGAWRECGESVAR